MTNDYYVPGEGLTSKPTGELQPATPHPEADAYVPAQPAPAQAPEPEPQSPRILVEPEADPEPYSHPAHSPAPAPEPDAAQAQFEAWAEEESEPRQGIGKKVLVAVILVAAIAIGGLAGVFYAKSSSNDDVAQPTPEPAAVQSGAMGTDFAFAIEAEGWNAETSTPFIVLARGTTADGTVVDTARAFATADFTWQLAEGTYTFTLVPPVNADGSTYASADLTSRDGSGFTSAVLDRIEAGSVTQKQALAILNSIDRAIGSGDETVAGAAGRAFYDLAKSYLPETETATVGASGAEAEKNGSATDKHKHEWIPETVNGKPIYVDGAPIYGNGGAIYEYHAVCSCGIDCTAAGMSPSYHLATHGDGGYGITENVPVIVGYEQIITGYEQKLAGYEQVLTGDYVCSCGEKKKGSE